MRIAALVDFPLPIENVEYYEQPFVLVEATVLKEYDLLITDIRYLGTIYEIRDAFSTIIFLSPRCNNNEYARVLKIGDYCYRYEELEYLKMRVEYIRRKSYQLKTEYWRQNEIFFDLRNGRLYKGGQELPISVSLLALLNFLIKHRNRYVDKYEIIENIDEINTEGSLKVSISRLRSLGLEIETKQGLGYKLKGD